LDVVVVLVDAEALMVLIDIPNNTAQAVATSSIPVRSRQRGGLVSRFN
jgi:hypothetical protein